MVDHLRLAALHQADEVLRAHVYLVEVEAPGPCRPRLSQVGERTGGKVVHHLHAVAFGEQPVDERRADEACSPGYKGVVGHFFLVAVVALGTFLAAVVALGAVVAVVVAVLRVAVVLGAVVAVVPVLVVPVLVVAVLGADVEVVGSVVVAAAATCLVSAETTDCGGWRMSGVWPGLAVGMKAMVTSWSFSSRTPELQSGLQVSS